MNSLFDVHLIKKYYTQKAEAAKIRSRIKWAEEGERSTRYFFELEKNQGENKMCPINITPVLFLPLNLTFWFYILFKDSLNYFYFQFIR
jgi:hypothetical protein